MNYYLQWYQLVGVLGTIIYVGSYTLTQIGWIRAPGYTYSVSNLIAAGMVGISLLYDFNLASALIQLLWIVISIVGITKLVRCSSAGSTNFHGDSLG